MNNLELIHRRNRLLMKILWPTWFISIILYIALRLPANMIIQLFFIGLLLCGFISFATWKKILIVQTMYISVIGVTIFIYKAISLLPTLSVFSCIFIVLAIATLYANMPVIITEGILLLVMVNYLYFVDKNPLLINFGLRGLIGCCVVIIIMVVVLAVQSKFSEKLRIEANNAKQEALSSKEKAEIILERLRQAIDQTVNFGDVLKSDISETMNISDEVTKVFNEVSKSIESQANSINDIAVSMRINDDSAKSLHDASITMNAISDSTMDSTKEGFKQAANLKQRMEEINSIVSDTSETINLLNQNSSKIESILNMINAITVQTNLLSLNASIEAARAGEQGKGFSVVANEIKKLSENSAHSVKDISVILKEIQQQAAKAAEAINQSMNILAMSMESSETVEISFRGISSNAEHVVEQAKKFNWLIKEFENESSKVMDEISSISSITEENTASVEEVLASINQQNEKISHITDSFAEFQSTIKGLESLYV